MSVWKAEHIKMSHSPWWLLFLVLPCMPAAMGVVNYLNNIEILKSRWYSLWTQETLFYSNFFFGPLIGLCCSYQWRMEHKGKNWNRLLTAPQPGYRILGAKLFVAFGVTLFLQLWVGILFFATGKMVHLPGTMPKEIVFWLIRGTIAGLTIAAIQSFLSLVIRNFSVPILMALAGSVTGLLANAKGLGIYWPYSLMLTGMNANKYEDMLAGSQVGFWLSCGIYFFLFFFLALTFIRKQAE